LLPGAWTPDERTLIAVRSGDLLALSVQDGGPTAERPLVATPAEESFPHLSPDGRWLAYASAAGGSGLQIVVQSFPDLKGRWQVSTAGGVAPCWSPDGTELFYLQSTRAGNREDIMMKVQFSPGSSGSHPTFGQPVQLFDFGPYETTNPTRSFDVSPDGKRFLVHRSDYPDDVPPPSRINLVVNWDEELKRRLAR
jgi:Tol biopolymer transport system component